MLAIKRVKAWEIYDKEPVIGPFIWIRNIAVQCTFKWKSLSGLISYWWNLKDKVKEKLPLEFDDMLWLIYLT